MANSPKQKRILLAEDDASISEVISIILQEENYNVSVPSNFENLKLLLKEQIFDLILLDVLLWGENSSQLCMDIKSDPEKKQIPVILLSARNDAKFIAKTVGADSVIEKPFEVDTLIDKVKQYLH